MEPILVYITSPMNSFAHMVRSLFPMSVDMWTVPVKKYTIWLQWKWFDYETYSEFTKKNKGLYDIFPLYIDDAH
jgi:hypothetical protein